MSIYHIKPSIDLTLYPEIHKPNNLSLEFKPNETIKAEVVDQLPSGRVIVRIGDVYVNMRTEIPLQKDTVLFLKVLPPKNEQKDIQLQLLSFKPPKLDLSFLQKIDDPRLYFFLKGSVDRGELIGMLEKKGTDAAFQDLLKQQTSLQDLNGAALKEFVDRSGLFFEKKLAQLVELNDQTAALNELHAKIQEFQKMSGLSYERIMDLLGQAKGELVDERFQGIFNEILRLHKRVANKSQQEIDEQIQKLRSELKEDLKQTLPPSLTLHQQLFSCLIDGLYLHLPLWWEDLEDATMVIQPRQEGHFVQIDLHFQDIGRAGANAFMHEQDLKVLFFAEDRGFLHFLAQGFETLEAELQKDFRYAFIGVGKKIETKELVKRHLVEKRV